MDSAHTEPQPPEPQPAPVGADAEQLQEPGAVGADAEQQEPGAGAAPTGWGADLMTAARGANGSSMVIEISDPRVSCVPPSHAPPCRPSNTG